MSMEHCRVAYGGLLRTIVQMYGNTPEAKVRLFDELTGVNPSTRLIKEGVLMPSVKKKNQTSTKAKRGHRWMPFLCVMRVIAALSGYRGLAHDACLMSRGGRQIGALLAKPRPPIALRGSQANGHPVSRSGATLFAALLMHPAGITRAMLNG